jgi:hypothetical protein
MTSLPANEQVTLKVAICTVEVNLLLSDMRRSAREAS